MKLVIFGATGGIGRQVLEQAIAAGHDVTAVVRDPKKLSTPVRSVTMDMATANSIVLKVILEGADAVLSGLGPRSAAEAGVATRGTQSIIQAMNENGVRRIVVVSAAPVATVPSPGRPRPPQFDPGDAFVMRYILGPIIKTVLRKHYADLAIMEDKLRESNLDWTIVRPPQLNDAALTKVYRTALGQNLPRGMLISRADVAHLMLNALEQPETIRQTVGIAY